MWKTIAIAAMLGTAAGPQILHAVAPSPVAQPLPKPLVKTAPPGGQRFAAICRGDQLPDSRPDPAWVRQSFNQDHCQAPQLPALIEGARATRQQVVAYMTAAKSYAAAADAFQKCVNDFVAAKAAAARMGAPPLTPAQVVLENHRILASLRSKDKAQAQVNAVVNAFNEYGSECPDHG